MWLHVCYWSVCSHCVCYCWIYDTADHCLVTIFYTNWLCLNWVDVIWFHWSHWWLNWDRIKCVRYDWWNNRWWINNWRCDRGGRIFVEQRKQAAQEPQQPQESKQSRAPFTTIIGLSFHDYGSWLWSGLSINNNNLSFRRFNDRWEWRSDLFFNVDWFLDNDRWWWRWRAAIYWWRRSTYCLWWRLIDLRRWIVDLRRGLVDLGRRLVCSAV